MRVTKAQSSEAGIDFGGGRKLDMLIHVPSYQLTDWVVRSSAVHGASITAG